jgi:competence protein ComEA
MLSWIKARLRNHFGFSKTETNGTLVLLVVTSICLLVPQVLKWYQEPTFEVNHDQDIALLEATLKKLEAHKASPQPATKRTNLPKLKKQSKAFNINTASATQLSTIKGIGPVLSARIVKFRNKLGGFTHSKQYEEVYGLLPEVVEHLKKHTYISANFQPTQLNINTADLKTLAAHPYLTYQQAKSIVGYREQHGPFSSLEALNALVLLDQASLKKVKPYLTAP